MDTISKAIEMITAEFKKEFGEDARIEEGDTIASVFNDGTVVLEMTEGELKINITAGKPYFFDYNLDLLEPKEPVKYKACRCKACSGECLCNKFCPEYETCAFKGGLGEGWRCAGKKQEGTK